MGARGPQKNQVYLPTDKTRRTAFLRGLRDSGGSFAAACRASAPHLKDEAANPPGYSTWKSLIARDASFAAQVDEIMAQVRDDIEAEMHRRSVRGVDQPVYQKAQRIFEPVLDDDGEPVLDKNGHPRMKAASITRYSDALLMKRAAALMPDRYGEKREINVNVNSQSNGAWTIGVADLEALSETQQEQLASIMATVRAHRKGATAQIEHHGEVELEDVTDGDREYAPFDLGEGDLDD